MVTTTVTRVTVTSLITGLDQPEVQPITEASQASGYPGTRVPRRYRVPGFRWYQPEGTRVPGYHNCGPPGDRDSDFHSVFQFPVILTAECPGRPAACH
eukprot:2894934-Rhodomonas_salina.1